MGQLKQDQDHYKNNQMPSSYNSQTKTHQQSIISKLLQRNPNFYIETHPSSLIVLTILYALPWLHYYSLLPITTPSNNQNNNISQSFSFLLHQNLTIIMVVFSLIKIINILLLLYENLSQHSHSPSLFSQHRYLILLDVFLSSAASKLIPLWLSLFLYIQSSAIYIYTTIFKTNLFESKDILASSSLRSALFVTLMNMLANFWNIIGQNSMVVAIPNLICSGVFVWWYLQTGWMTFIHNLSKICLHIYVTFTFALYFTACLSFYCNLTNFLTPLTISFITLSAMTYLSILHNQHSGIMHSKLINKTHCLQYYLNLRSIQSDCLIDGIISHHITSCQSIHCFCHKQSAYHCKSNRQVNIAEIHHESKYIIQFIIKAEYDQLMKKQHRQQDEIDFAVFMYFSFKNMSKIWGLLCSLNIQKLGILQYIKINKLKRVITTESHKLGINLNKGLQLQNIITVEQTFTNINNNLSALLTTQSDIWREMEEDILDMNKLNVKIQAYLQSIAFITDQFQGLVKYITFNLKFKYCLLFFNFFFKNQKVKHSAITKHSDQNQSILSEVEEKPNEKIYKLYDPDILFLQSTCFITAVKMNKQLIVKNVSKNFNKIFDYARQQVITESVSKLLPTFQQNMHDLHVIQWQQQGYCNSEQTYSVKQVFGLSKTGILLPLFKYIKLYINTQGSFEYLSMLRLQTNKNGMILTDSQFNIQGASPEFLKNCSIWSSDYELFRRINLSQMIPQLVQKRMVDDIRTLTKIEHRDQDMYLMSRFGSSQFLGKLQQEIMDVKIRIPDNFSYIKQKMGLVQNEDKINFISTAHHIAQLNSLYNSEQVCKINKRAQILVKKYNCKYQSQQFGFIIYAIFKNQETFQTSSYIGRRRGQQNSRLHFGIAPTHQNFHQCFDVQQDYTTTMLKTDSNIFFKDEEDRPLAESQSITSFKLFIRLAFILIVGCLLGLMGYTLTSWNRLTNYNKQTMTMIQFSTYPYRFGFRYFYSQLNYSNYAQDDTLRGYLQQMNQILYSPSMKQIVYNLELNSYDIYCLKDGSCLDSNQFLYAVVSSISSVATSPQNQSLFQQLLNPSFHQFTNHITNNFQNIQHKQLQIWTQIFIISYSGIFLIAIILYIIANYLANRYFHFVGQFLMVLGQINHKDIQDIGKHLRRIKGFLKQIRRYQQENVLSQAQTQTMHATMKRTNKTYQPEKQDQIKETVDSLNLNKRQKPIIQCCRQKCLRRKVRFILFLLIIFMTAGVTTIVLLQQPKMKTLQIVALDGIKLFKIYPAIFACLLPVIQNNYYQPAHRNYYQEYGDIVDAVRLFSELPYMGNNVNSVFLNLEKQYYFTDLCAYPQLFPGNEYQSECMGSKQVNFRSGLISILKLYLSDIQIKQHQNTTKAQFDHLFTHAEIMTATVLQLMQNWQQNIMKLTEQLNDCIVLVVLGMAIGFVCACFTVVQLIMFGGLKQSYQHYRSIYQYLVPNSLMLRQKMIRFRLKQLNFIK